MRRKLFVKQIIFLIFFTFVLVLAPCQTESTAPEIKTVSTSEPAPDAPPSADANAPAPKKKTPTTVVIEQAQSTEYRKDVATGIGLIVLKGNVRLSVTQEKSKSVITADLINFDRDRQMLYAEGNVKLEKLSGDKLSETLTSTSLLFNVETQEGVFDAGRVVQEQTDAINLPSGSTLIVSSDMFGRDDSGTIAFKNGSLTFCDDPDPHWKIKASRIWLLPGNEFAFANALLYVGKLPIFYLPFFYYPKDEMIFNPAFGFEARKGYYMQTTTYIVGRKPLEKKSDEESFFDFMRPTQLKEQVREGLFMHNLEQNAQSPTNYMKVMADYYSSLGGMVGVSGSFKPGKVLTNLEFSAALGFSRSLFYDSINGGTYIPYYSGEQYWDSSALFGLNLPFRYQADLKMTLSHTYGNLTLSMPLYSDAYFQSDFLTDRAETMDWIDFLTNNPILTADDTVTTTETSSYVWSLTGSIKPNIKAFSPFINNFSISSITSSMTFYSKMTTLQSFKDMYPDDSTLAQRMYNYSPMRKFYYPSQVVPLKATLNFSGNIVSFPKSATNVKKEEQKTDPRSKIAFIDPLSEKENPVEKSAQASTEKAEETPKQSEPAKLPESVLPTINVPSPNNNSSTSAGIKYTLSYSIVPVFSSLLSYDSTEVLIPDDIDLTNILSSFYSISAPIELKSALSTSSNNFSLNNSVKFTLFNQDHPILQVDESGYVGTSLESTIVTNDYAAKKYDLLNTNSLSYKPFTKSKYFSDTSISWNSTLKLIRTDFDGTYDSPSWVYDTFGWDDDTFTAHNLNMIFAAKEGKYVQRFTFQSDLPPRDDSYMGQVSLTFPFMTFSAKTTFSKETAEDESVTWEWDPFVQSSTWTLFNSKLKFTQAFNYEIEEEQSTSFTFGVSYGGLSLSYSHQFTYSYQLTSAGWEIEDEKDFVPYSLNLAYRMPTKKVTLWKNRINLSTSLSTGLTADMIRPTNSYFTFSPSLTISINKFIDLTFSAVSRNEVIFRYVQDLFDYDQKVPGETNILQDLWDSFSFWDTEARKSSGFKMKSLSLKVEHNLHDWDLSLEVTIKPTLITSKTPYTYNFDPYISLSVLWRPMSSMKTAIVSEYDADVDDVVIQLNPGD